MIMPNKDRPTCIIVLFVVSGHKSKTIYHDMKCVFELQFLLKNVCNTGFGIFVTLIKAGFCGLSVQLVM